jgi:DNA-directed RNA polymerase specialized sigma24 family protein
MFGARKAENEQPSPYASRADFCRIYESHMKPLYLLAFLLTADQTLAEQCFVGGLHISQEGNHVFREWAESWARRAIILNAIRMVRPLQAADHTQPAKDGSGWPEMTKRTEITQIRELPTFERFIFVMSVLEGYSDQECSLHLGCVRGDVVAARSRALQRMGRSAQIVSIDSGQEAGIQPSNRGGQAQPDHNGGLLRAYRQVHEEQAALAEPHSVSQLSDDCHAFA